MSQVYNYLILHLANASLVFSIKEEERGKFILFVLFCFVGEVESAEVDCGQGSRGTWET